MNEVPQVGEGAPPPLASDGRSAQTNTVLAVYRGDLRTRVSSVATTQSASDDVLVHLFTEQIIHSIPALPDQSNLVGLDGEVADEAQRLPLGVDHFLSTGLQSHSTTWCCLPDLSPLSVTASSSPSCLCLPLSGCLLSPPTHAYTLPSLHSFIVIICSLYVDIDFYSHDQTEH